MFYTEMKLVESIQQDRQREAQAARLARSARLSRRARRRGLALPRTITQALRRPRPTQGVKAA